jgi:hypothetical protein
LPIRTSPTSCAAIARTTDSASSTSGGSGSHRDAVQIQEGEETWPTHPLVSVREWVICHIEARILSALLGQVASEFRRAIDEREAGPGRAQRKRVSEV